MEKTRYSLYKVLLQPLVLLIILAGFYFYSFPLLVQFQEKTKIIIGNILIIGLFINITWFISRFIDAFIFEVFLRGRFGVQMPRIIHNIVDFVLYFIMCLIIINYIFEQSILGLLAASGAITIVIGLSLDNLISDLFEGLLLSFDRPFVIKDEIRLQTSTLDVIVEVIEITWRTTRFLNLFTNAILIVPNSVLANMTYTNLRKNQVSFAVPLDSTIPIKRAKRILKASILGVDVILRDFPIRIDIGKIEKGVIEYIIFGYFDTTKVDIVQAQNKITEELIKNLRKANIQSYLPKSTHYHIHSNKTALTQNDSNKILPFLKNITFFQHLNKEEMLYLSQQMQRMTFQANETIVKINEPGDSMFIIEEGLLEVLIPVSGKPDLTHVAYLTIGQPFGEMSLFTGAPRSATILCKTEVSVFEIKKITMHYLFEKNTHLVEKIGHIIATRELSNINVAKEVSKQLMQHKESLTKKIINNIYYFFKLKERDE